MKFVRAKMFFTLIAITATSFEVMFASKIVLCRSLNGTECFARQCLQINCINEQGRLIVSKDCARGDNPCSRTYRRPSNCRSISHYTLCSHSSLCNDQITSNTETFICVNGQATVANHIPTVKRITAVAPGDQTQAIIPELPIPDEPDWYSDVNQAERLAAELMKITEQEVNESSGITSTMQTITLTNLTTKPVSTTTISSASRNPTTPMNQTTTTDNTPSTNPITTTSTKSTTSVSTTPTTTTIPLSTNPSSNFFSAWWTTVPIRSVLLPSGAVNKQTTITPSTNTTTTKTIMPSTTSTSRSTNSPITTAPIKSAFLRPLYPTTNTVNTTVSSEPPKSLDHESFKKNSTTIVPDYDAEMKTDENQTTRNNMTTLSNTTDPELTTASNSHALQSKRSPAFRRCNYTFQIRNGRSGANPVSLTNSYYWYTILLVITMSSTLKSLLFW